MITTYVLFAIGIATTVFMGIVSQRGLSTNATIRRWIRYAIVSCFMAVVALFYVWGTVGLIQVLVSPRSLVEKGMAALVLTSTLVGLPITIYLESSISLRDIFRK